MTTREQRREWRRDIKRRKSRQRRAEPPWWPTAEQKRHADAGCAHPDECLVERPDFEQLSRESVWPRRAWEEAWGMLSEPKAWPTLVDLVHRGGWHPVNAAGALIKALVPELRCRCLPSQVCIVCKGSRR